VDDAAEQPDKLLPIHEFVGTFKKPLTWPIILSPLRLRITRATRAKEMDDEDLVPKRSARAKSKFRALKPEAHARKVMMKRIGLDVENEVPNEASRSSRQRSSSRSRHPLGRPCRYSSQVGRSGLREPFAPSRLYHIGRPA